MGCGFFLSFLSFRDLPFLTRYLEMLCPQVLIQPCSPQTNDKHNRDAKARLAPREVARSTRQAVALDFRVKPLPYPRREAPLGWASRTLTWSMSMCYRGLV